MISEISDARTRPWVQWRARGRSRAVSPARNGFTLLELLLVLAVLSVLGSLALPQVAWLLGDRRIVRGARLVREELVLARVEAMRQGRIYMLDAELPSVSLRVRPYNSLSDSVNALDQTGTQAGLLTGAEQGQMTVTAADESETRTIELPEDVSVDAINVVSAARALEIQQQSTGEVAQGFSQPILFYPDGTTSTAAITLTHPTHGRITISLRGITGDVTLSEVQANP